MKYIGQSCNNYLVYCRLITSTSNLQTLVIMPIRVSGMLKDNFPEPKEFKPERWSRQNKDNLNVFASLPFGFGVRMCVGEFTKINYYCKGEST